MRSKNFQSALIVTVLVSSALFFSRTFGEEERLTEASSSFSELYNDRLLAEHLIYRMTELVHEKQLLYLSSGKRTEHDRQSQLSTALDISFKKLQATRLTYEEDVALAKLHGELRALDRREAGHPLQRDMEATLGSCERALSLLHSLSDIQVKEGSRLQVKAQGALAGSLAGIKLQSAIFIVLMLSILVLAKNAFVNVRLPGQHELN